MAWSLFYDPSNKKNEREAPWRFHLSSLTPPVYQHAPFRWMCMQCSHVHISPVPWDPEGSDIAFGGALGSSQSQVGMGENLRLHCVEI